jgi:type II secretion system protein H
MRLQRSHAAFTLIELMLVMVVIAFAAAMVVPLLGNSAKGRRAGDNAAQIVSLTQYARSQAVSLGKTCRVVLDLEARSYAIAVQDTEGFVVLDNWTFYLPEGVWLETDIPEQQDGVYIEFKPTGRTDPATIRVRDENGAVVEVVCESATEMFHVVDSVR